MCIAFGYKNCLKKDLQILLTFSLSKNVIFVKYCKLSEVGSNLWHHRRKRQRNRRRNRNKPEQKEDSSGWFPDWLWPKINWDIFGIFSDDSDEISDRMGENSFEYYDSDYEYFDENLNYPDLIQKLAFVDYVYPKTRKHFKNFEAT